MSLTQNDLDQIRTIVIEGVEAVTGPQFDELRHEIAGIKKDIVKIRADISTLKHDVSYLKSEVRLLNQKFDSLDGRVEALENDIKEIYAMLSQPKSADKDEQEFHKLSLEKKILLTYKNTIITAKEAGVNLPH